MRLLWRTDIHFSEHTPRYRRDNWMETLSEKIRWVGEKARELGCDAVIDGGDFFDIKSPLRNSHRLVQEAIKAHRDYPCPVYCCVGNHDCKFGDYSYLPEQPLGVLFEAGVFQRLYDQFEYVKDGVRVVGIPYHGTKYDHDRFRIEKGSENHLVVVAHVLASRKGGSMFEAEDILSYKEFNDLCPDADIACFGHWHMDQGIEKHGNTHFVNVGSLSRGSLSQDNLSRKPCVVLMEFEGNQVKLERFDLPILSPEDAFDVDRKEEEILKTTAMESFVENISLSLRQTEKISFRDAIMQVPDLPESVRERAIQYLEKVGAQ